MCTTLNTTSFPPQFSIFGSAPAQTLPYCYSSFHGSLKRLFYRTTKYCWYLQIVNKELVFTNSWEIPVESLQIMVAE